MNPYNGAFSGQEIDAAIAAVQQNASAWSAKQDPITGQPGQVVGFDEDGNAVPQDAPSGGGAGIPSGCILIWSGAKSNIPDGWALCDGTNGTPDLRDAFVLGAGGTYEVGDTGGEETHTLTKEEMPSHQHVQRIAVPNSGTNPLSQSVTNTIRQMQYYAAPATSVPGGATYGSPYVYSVNSAATFGPVATANTGSGAAHNNMPPYYALCYIMKL